MRIIRDDKRIKLNSRIGQITGLGGLLILVGGMYISFKMPNLFSIAWLALLVGFTLSQISIYLSNRYGRRPRPDEHLDAALKGLDDRYTLYHYSAPSPHMLLGPTGLWVLLPRHQAGKISFEKGRWRQKGGGFFQTYLRIFAQESLGRPDLDKDFEADKIKKYIHKHAPDLDVPDIQIALVITNDKAEIADVEAAPFPTVEVKKLKDLVRKKAKEKGLAPEKVEQLQKAFEE